MTSPDFGLLIPLIIIFHQDSELKKGNLEINFSNISPNMKANQIE